MKHITTTSLIVFSIFFLFNCSKNNLESNSGNKMSVTGNYSKFKYKENTFVIFEENIDVHKYIKTNKLISAGWSTTLLGNNEKGLKNQYISYPDANYTDLGMPYGMYIDLSEMPAQNILDEFNKSIINWIFKVEKDGKTPLCKIVGFSHHGQWPFYNGKDKTLSYESQINK